MQGSYAVYVRDKDGTLISRINDYVSLHLLMTLNDVGTWSIGSTTIEKCPFSAGDGILVTRNGVFFYGGVLTEISDEFDAKTGLHDWQVKGNGDLEYLNRRICYVDPSSGRTDQHSYYTDSGNLSAVVLDLIHKNLGQGALIERKEPIIETITQSSTGPYISVSLRFQNLLKTVTALVSGNGYNIRANWDETNNKVFYDIYQGRDLTESIVFSEHLNNILASEYLASVPQGNFILAGGTGELTQRTFQTAQSADSISEWGRIEYFQDARNQNSLTGYADEILAEKTENTIGYSCTASTDDLTPQFGVDYGLGDLVGMKVFGQFVTAEVQQCEITVANGIQTVEPRFGTVAIGKLRNIFQQLDKLRKDVDELLGTEVA